MKKLLLCLTILVSSLLFVSKVNASDFNVTIVGNNTFEDEIILYVEVDNLDDFKGSCNGLCGLVGKLNYDMDKIELISIKPLEEFELTQGKTLVLYKTKGVSEKTKILSIKFKNKSLKKNEEIKITFSNIVASDGDKDINASDVTKVIKFTNTKNENNNVTNNITNKKEQTKESDNNYLKSITLSEGKLDFNKDVFTYDITVGYETKSIEIKASAFDDKAIIDGIGTRDLNIGNNVIKLIVKSQDGIERTYTLNVNRKDKDVIIDKNNEVIKENTNNNTSNSIFLVVIIFGILVIGIIGFIILKRKNNE